MNDFLLKARSEVEKMPTPKLREEFARGLQVTAERLTWLAVALHELEVARGEKVEGVPEALLTLLRRIAGGELLPEVVVRFAGTPKTMARVGKLPVDEQEAVVSGEKPPPEPPPRKPAKLHESGQTREAIEDKNYLAMAERATVKDLAEMIAELIARHPQPKDVWRLLCADPFVRVNCIRDQKAANTK